LSEVEAWILLAIALCTPLLLIPSMHRSGIRAGDDDRANR
jgi:hypothetical protein